MALSQLITRTGEKMKIKYRARKKKLKKTTPSRRSKVLVNGTFDPLVSPHLSNSRTTLFQRRFSRVLQLNHLVLSDVLNICDYDVIIVVG